MRDGRADERVGVVRPVGAVETERGLAADGGYENSVDTSGNGSLTGAIMRKAMVDDGSALRRVEKRR